MKSDIEEKRHTRGEERSTKFQKKKTRASGEKVSKTDEERILEKKAEERGNAREKSEVTRREKTDA